MTKVSTMVSFIIKGAMRVVSQSWSLREWDVVEGGEGQREEELNRATSLTYSLSSPSSIFMGHMCIDAGKCRFGLGLQAPLSPPSIATICPKMLHSPSNTHCVNKKLILEASSIREFTLLCIASSRYLSATNEYRGQHETLFCSWTPRPLFLFYSKP